MTSRKALQNQAKTLPLHYELNKRAPQPRNVMRQKHSYEAIATGEGRKAVGCSVPVPPLPLLGHNHIVHNFHRGAVRALAPQVLIVACRRAV